MNVQAGAAAPIEFHFDFSSPYAYIASELIDALAEKHGRGVHWQPVLLGAAFKLTGAAPLVQVPLKDAYALRDFTRSARFHCVPLRIPARFPVSTLHAARAFLWFTQQDEMGARQFAQAVFRAYFLDGREIDQIEVVLDLAQSFAQPFDVTRAALAEALQGTVLKNALRDIVDRALSSGVFGVPWFSVDGEPFWGVDRLPQLERWLEQGSF